MTAVNELERLTAGLAGRYTIERQLGAGGMATVYLAHDIKHDRKVALKVIRPELAAVLGTERFLNEIKVTANLHHPHILGLIDSGSLSSGAVPAGRQYYVMPFVEGGSLRDRLRREKQLSITESLAITKAVASALDFAHRRGVIHRDIKPENILFQDDQPVVADFGIALAVSTAGGSRLTETGISLGTPQYMSPEQATGEPMVDARSDIYSLGCVLYEMLAAEPPYTGGTAQAIVAKVIADQLRPISELRGTVPNHVSVALNVALAKLPADRFTSAADFVAALEGRSVPGIVPSVRPMVAVPRKGLLPSLPWVLVAAVSLLAAWLATRKPAPSELTRYLNISLPDSAPLVFIGDATYGMGQPALTLSPDGTNLVYVGQGRTGRRLYVKSLIHAREVRALKGTDGAFGPFFSPDGQWIGFFVEDQLKRVSLSGDQILQIAQVHDPFGGSWSGDNRIAVIVQDGAVLGVVPATGGQVKHIPMRSRGAHPAWLQDGEWIMHSCSSPQLHLCATSATTGETRDVREASSASSPPAIVLGSNARLLPTGHIAFSALATNVAMVAAFDPHTATVTSKPAPALNGVRRENAWGAQQLAVSQNGVLIYATGDNAESSILGWADSSGITDSVPLPRNVYGGFDLSPDGRHLAVSVLRPNGMNELWFVDLQRGRARRWAGEIEGLALPSWAPTSDWLATRTSSNPATLLRIDAAAASGGDTLYQGQAALWVEDILPDGRLLVRYDPAGEAVGYLTLLTPRELRTLGEPGAAVPPRLILASGSQAFGRFSPDGRWLAFQSTQSGRYEIYAVRFPDLGTPMQISTDGGDLPQWAPRSSALFYRDGQRWYRVALTSSASEPFGDPVFYLEGDYLNVLGPEFNVGSDGRLLVLRGTNQRTTTSLTVVTNWFAEVERLVPRR